MGHLLPFSDSDFLWEELVAYLFHPLGMRSEGYVCNVPLQLAQDIGKCLEESWVAQLASWLLSHSLLTPFRAMLTVLPMAL